MSKTLTINGHLVRSAVLIPGGDVKAIGDGAQTLWEASQPDYFFIENYTQSANTVAFPKTGDAEEWVSLDYSLDGRTWYPYDLETGVSIPAGGKLYLKGDNANLSKSVSGAWTTHSFTSTGAILAGGNAVSLLDSAAPATKSVGQFGFACMFAGNTNLLSVDSAMFDGVGLAASYVFYKTFDGCTNLTNVPAFGGVTNVTQSSFTQTFRNCSSVTTAAGFLPNAVSTTSALVFQSCFVNCTGLVTPPDLSAIVPGAGNSVFIEMFRGCTSLATPAEVYSPVPDVTGTHKLAGMYNGCTSLTRSPQVYIPNPTANILLNTFTGCGSLDLIRVTFDSWGTDGEYTNEWTYGVHSTGVFCKTSSLPVTRNARDAAQSACDYIPYLWSIADQNGKLYAPVFTYDGQAGTMAIAEAEGGQSCEIYYTTDGTTPTPQTGALYTGAFAVTPGQTIKAISHYGGASAASVTDSDVATFEVPVDYFYVENLSNSANTVRMTGTKSVSLQKSTDPDMQEWDAFDPSTGVTLAAGEKVYLRGSNTALATSSDTRSFTSTGDAAVGGSAYTLIGNKSDTGAVNTTYALSGLFSGWTKLKSAAQNLLSRISFGTNATYAFKSMFYGCSGLKAVPEIPKTATRTGVYDDLVENSAADFIKVGFTSWPTSGWTDWTKGLTTYNSSMSAKGVFCCPSSLAKTRNTYSSFMPSMAKYNNIPIGWSIADEDGKLYTPTISFNGSTMKCTIAEYSSGKSCKIYYTTDGTIPTPQNGTLYSAAFTVAYDTRVKAIAHYDGASAAYVTDSDVASNYTSEYIGGAVFSNPSESDITVSLPKTGDAEEWLDLKCIASGQTAWSAFDPETGATVPAGGRLAIKYNTASNNGTGVYDSENGTVTYHTFTATGDFVLNIFRDFTGNDSPGTPYHFYRLFHGCTHLTEVVYHLNTNSASAEHAFESMFEGCTSLTGSVGITYTYDAPPAAWMYASMFKGCTLLTGASVPRGSELGESECESMFEGCASLTYAGSLAHASTLSGQRTFHRMFYGCTSLETAPEMPSADGGLEITGSSVFAYMFYNCTSLTAAPSLTVATPGAYCFDHMFYNCTSMTTAAGVSIGAAANYMCESMFQGCSSLTTLPTLPSGTANYSYRYMFHGCSALADASSLTVGGDSNYCCYSMFTNCTSLTAPPAVTGGTLGAFAFEYMFRNCTALTTSPSFTVSGTAQECCISMFEGCTQLTSAGGIRLNATTVGTSAYKTMFKGCTALTTPPVFTTSNITVNNNGMQGMFRDCTSLTSAPSFKAGSFATGSTSLTRYTYCLDGMFRGCTSLADAGGVKITSAKFTANSCQYMFYGCTALVNPPYITGPTSNTATSQKIWSDVLSYMFNRCTSLDMIRLTLAEWSRSSSYFTNAWTYQTAEYGVFCRSTIAVTRNASGATEGNCDYIPYKWSTADYSGKLDAPTVSGSASSVTISEANSGKSCQLYYTTDGTTPTPQNGTLYTGAFTVEAGTTVKAIAHYAGASASRITNSDVVSTTF